MGIICSLCWRHAEYVLMRNNELLTNFLFYLFGKYCTLFPNIQGLYKNLKTVCNSQLNMQIYYLRIGLASGWGTEVVARSAAVPNQRWKTAPKTSPDESQRNTDHATPPITDPPPPGSRLVNDKIVEVEDEVDKDRDIPDDERTARLLTEIGNNISLRLGHTSR